MPDPPPGEADLRALAERFSEAETRIRALIAHAPNGSRRSLLGEALKILTDLRREDFRGPVTAAYLYALREAGGGAHARTVRDLAASLHLKLDQGLQTAAANVREAIRKVTTDNVDEMVTAGVVAHEDKGRRWGLGSWGQMNTATIGRAASSRGVIDSKPRQVTIEVTGCSFCQEFEGTYPIAEVPGYPPFHPSCECTASAA